MRTRTSKSRAFHAIAALSLAVYGAVGVLGHGLHGLLPCHDSACHEHASLHGDHSHAGQSCCSHRHAHGGEVAATGKPAASAPGHDPDACSLCTLLAKIKVGRVLLYDLDLRFRAARCDAPVVRSLLPADLILSGTPRGPPRV